MITGGWAKYAWSIGLIAFLTIVYGTAVNLAATQQTLLWSDEFNGTKNLEQPNPLNWTYDTGADGWGNHELET
jgi:hypothetical protein